MKRVLLNQLVAFAIFALLFGACPAAANSPPKKGGKLPRIDLSVPGEHAHRAYLGLSGDGVFTIPQIEADVVIIEILNSY